IRSGHGARNMQSPRTNFSDSYRDVFLVAVRDIRAVTLIQRQLSAATEVGSSAGVGFLAIDQVLNLIWGPVEDPAEWGEAEGFNAVKESSSIPAANVSHPEV
ncbi:hypothetical protein KXX64_001324, partial [Aspergillus fumigatus]